MLDSVFDQLTLRNGYYDEKGSPRFTTGSIVSGALMRAMLTVMLGFAIWYYVGSQLALLFSAIAIWGYVAYPAHRQYTIFNQHVEQLELNTLCGQCKHFNPTNQLCSVYDEHVSNDFIPCEGMDWEPRP